MQPRIKAALAIGALMGAVACAFIFAKPAQALPSLESVRSMPAAGFQGFESFTVTCSTSATAIAPSSDLAFSSLYCENNSTTSVFYGGSGVTTSNAPCISTTSASCLRSAFSADVSRGKPYCIVASGTQALKCIGGA